MTRQQLVGIVTAAVLCTMLAVGIGAFLMSGEGDRPRAERRLARLEAPTKAVEKPVGARQRAAPAKRKPAAVPAARTGKPAAPAARTGKPQGTRLRDMDPAVRATHREDALARRTEKLETYASSRGWDAAVTEEVGAIITETADYASGTMARVEAGADFAELRQEIRAFRTKQADAIKDVIGEDEFPAFVDAMGMQRFFGEGGAPGARAGSPRQRGGAARGGR